MRNILFRYSGNKSRLIDRYRRPPVGTRRVVEPYLGSGAYLLSTDLPGLGFETNGDVVAMWKWLSSASPAELKDLNDAHRSFMASAGGDGKPDARGMNLPVGPQTYVRVNCSGVMVGQLTSWKLNPQHRLPVEGTIRLLPRLKDIEVRHGSANQYVSQDGDLLFVDPPYLGTVAGYVEKGRKRNHEEGYSADDTVRLIAGTKNPIIFTYGDGAAERFPSCPWDKVVVRKVPNIRRGGTVDRTEWVSYLNW